MNHRREVASVFCVDDQAVIRDALRQIIESTPGFRWVGQAACAEDALKAVPVLRPDVVLVDIHMPGMGGYEAAKILADSRRNLVVVLMSAEPAGPPESLIPHTGPVPVVAKVEICSRLLLDLWHGRTTR